MRRNVGSIAILTVAAAAFAAGWLVGRGGYELPPRVPLSESAPASSPAARFDPPPPPEPGEAHLMLVGDILPLEDRDYFGAVAPLLKSAHLTVGNLECPISSHGRRIALKLNERGAPLPNEFLFRVAPTHAERLADAGLDAVSLANNHCMDYGPQALLETIRLLDRAGIGHTGAGVDLDTAREPVIATVAGQRVALLAYVGAGTLPDTDGFAATATSAGAAFVRGDASGALANKSSRMIANDIRHARALADFVVIAFHCGTEARATPDPPTRALAHHAIHCGADMVVGHHPHVLQGIEIYQGSPICYSLGNFVFPTPWESTEYSAAFEVVLRDGRWRRIVMHPVKLRRRAGDPQPATGDDLRRIIRRVTGLSQEMGTECEVRESGGRTTISIANPNRPGPRRHLLKAEAEAFTTEPHPELDGMSVVHFLAWDLTDGEKVPRGRQVVVNSALAEDVLAIFEEIYLAPERFPIHEIIGYDYRTVTGGSRLSWHALGRAIDINRAENPMIEDGRKLVHPDEPPYEPKEWLPGEDPYSIPRDGSVVRAFRSHGWRWGGDWSSCKDYQHFDRPRG